MYLTKSRPCGTAVSKPAYFNDEFVRQFFGPTLGTFHQGGPAINIKETETEFLLELVAPGIAKENFHLKVEKNKLIVSAEWENQSKENQPRYVRREFEAQRFQKTFILPEAADSDKIAAQYTNGVLHVSVPKKEHTSNENAKTIVIN